MLFQWLQLVFYFLPSHLTLLAFFYLCIVLSSGMYANTHSLSHNPRWMSGGPLSTVAHCHLRCPSYLMPPARSLTGKSSSRRSSTKYNLKYCIRHVQNYVQMETHAFAHTYCSLHASMLSGLSLHAQYIHTGLSLSTCQLPWAKILTSRDISLSKSFWAFFIIYSGFCEHPGSFYVAQFSI